MPLLNRKPYAVDPALPQGLQPDEEVRPHSVATANGNPAPTLLAPEAARPAARG